MLINKKFLALALLPLFGACVVNDSDDDTGAGTDTDVSTTNPTTTTPTTTDPATTDPSTTEPTSTTDPATTDPSGTESETDSADTSESDTDTGGDAGFCLPACEEAIDCCAGEPTCEGGIGTYPYAWSCDANTCTFGGCTTDDECTFGGVIVGNVCDEDTGVCGFGCAEDVDCAMQIGTTVCNGVYCEAPPCTGDADCTAPLTCDVDSGFCVGAGCESDEDCAGFGVCDVATGACGCTTDKECGEGFGCAL